MFDDAPTWIRALQAALIGVIAGIVLHVLFSFVVVYGDAPGQKPPAPAQCKKANPARDAAAPAGVSRISAAGRRLERTL